jgi:hypothetical protein
MLERPIRILILFALPLVSATIALAQSGTFKVPLNSYASDWQIAQQIASSEGKLIVVTVDRPDRRQTCRIQSFTQDKLVCARAFAGPRTYLPKQIAALIIPGDAGLKLPVVLGINVGMGAAIWGTVVLAAACPACAVATGILALLLFGAAGAVLMADDQPERLLYRAPGQQLSRKLGNIQPSL